MRSIGDSAFTYCNGLTSCRIAWKDTTGISVNSAAFYGRVLDTLFVPVGTTSLYQSVAPWNTFDTIIEYAGSDATLKSLTMSTGTLSPAFDPAVTIYGIRVADSNSDITINAAPNDDSVKSVVGIGSKNLAMGTNAFNIVVTAENGTDQTNYLVVVIRENTLVIHDTIHTIDTAYSVINDTILLYDTIHTIDTAYSIINDTILLHDTIFLYDTVYLTDTVYIVINDTIPTTNSIVSTTVAVAVYPNPVVNGELRIENGELKSGDKIEIYNVNGAFVETWHAASLQGNTINIAHLPAGEYIVKVGGSAGSPTRIAKVVKNKE
ncbi:hypothetical protein FACS1894201_08900 [Bacteroidia bacterium]|nr:hypothetical protein FACS1894201_08900 [Bacteroidia bacterium]